MSDKETGSETNKEKKPNWFKRHKILTGILVLIIVSMFIGAAGDSSNKSTTSQPTTQPVVTEQEAPSATKAPKPTATPLSYEQVDAKAMITEFDENQLAAEKKYEKKLVEFKAKISNISEDVFGTPFLSLVPTSSGDAYFGTSLKCNFENSDAITAVKKGQIVTIQGEVGTQSMGIIVVKDCKLVE